MFKNSFITLAAAAVLASASSVLAADFVVDPSHSRIGFSVRHLVSKVPGEFKDYEGSFSFDEKKPEASKASFTIKAASINTNFEKRDEHLRSPDFFNTAKHPTLTFVSKKVAPAGKGKYKLQGDITIAGVTKPVTFEVEYAGTAKDPWGGTRAGFTAVSKVNRKDFGMVWNKALDSGGFILGDDVEIKLDLEAIQK